MKATKVVVGQYEYTSRSQAALDLLQQRAEGHNKFSKAEIARKVGMTPQTVHRVQTNNDLVIDFSDSPRGRPSTKLATKAKKNS